MTEFDSESDEDEWESHINVLLAVSQNSMETEHKSEEESEEQEGDETVKDEETAIAKMANVPIMFHVS